MPGRGEAELTFGVFFSGGGGGGEACSSPLREEAAQWRGLSLAHKRHARQFLHKVFYKSAKNRDPGSSQEEGICFWAEGRVTVQHAVQWLLPPQMPGDSRRMLDKSAPSPTQTSSRTGRTQW